MDEINETLAERGLLTLAEIAQQFQLSPRFVEDVCASASRTRGMCRLGAVCMTTLCMRRLSRRSWESASKGGSSARKLEWALRQRHRELATARPPVSYPVLFLPRDE